MNMKKTIALIPVLMLTSCAALDIDAVRMSGGFSDTKATAEYQIGGSETQKESATGTFNRANVEFVNKTEDDVEVGLRFGASRGDLQDIENTNYDVAATARLFLTDGSLRPFIEGAAGYRRVEVYDPVMLDKGESNALLGSVALGLEWQATSGFSIFASGGFEGAFGDDYEMAGPVFSFGGAVSF